VVSEAASSMGLTITPDCDQRGHPARFPLKGK
jgi:hypothetical protein